MPKPIKSESKTKPAAPRAKRSEAPAESATAPAAEPLAQAPQRDVLELFHPVTAEWFRQVFEGPTQPQREGWPAISSGDSTLILAPTGTGKTLTAFMWCLDKLMLQDARAKVAIAAAAMPAPKPIRARRKKGEKADPKPLLAPGVGVRVIYISPLKALAVDVERNLRSPLAGISNMAQRMGIPVHQPEISVRTGDTPLAERAKFVKHPGDILITTPESLYLLLTSNASEALRTVETVIIDEIHALVPSKRGAHMALSSTLR